jgi:hypothetical protein
MAAVDQEQVRMPGDLDGWGTAGSGGGSGIGLATAWLLGIMPATQAALPHLRRAPAPAIADLASPLAPSTVGTALAIDGGVKGLRRPADRS